MANQGNFFPTGQGNFNPAGQQNLNIPGPAGSSTAWPSGVNSGSQNTVNQAGQSAFLPTGQDLSLPTGQGILPPTAQGGFPPPAQGAFPPAGLGAGSRAPIVIPVPDTPDIAVTRRSKGSQFNDGRFAPNSPEVVHLTSAIKLSLLILKHPACRAHMVDLSILFTKAIWGQGCRPDVAEYFIDTFLRKIGQVYPLVVVDGTIEKIDCLGYHPRAPWLGALWDWQPRTQEIHVNADRTAHMLQAAQAAQYSQSNAHQQQRYRDFVFLMGTMLTHETIHLFLTFLGNGKGHTPKEHGIIGYNNNPQFGESGRMFERAAFGGTVEWYRDFTQDDGQAGLLYTIDAQFNHWKIDRSVIDEFNANIINLPFPREFNKPEELVLTPMGCEVRDANGDVVAPDLALEDIDTLYRKFTYPSP